MTDLATIPLEDHRFEGNDELGVLVLHGFTSSTTESVPIAQIFEKEGFTTSAPLLPGHGTTPDELNKTTWKQWVEKAEKEYEWLKTKSKKILIGGSSMGGALSLYLASKLKIDGVFTLGTPYDLRLKVKILTYFLNLIGKPLKKPEKTLKYYQQTGLKSYDRYPPKAMKQLKLLFNEMKKSLPQIKVPYSGHLGFKDDLTIPNDPIKILTKINSPKGSITWYKSSGHILITEPDKELVAKNLIEFAKQILNEKK